MVSNRLQSQAPGSSELTSSRVVRCEKAGGTSQRGKANEHGLVHVCVLGRDETRRPDQLARTGASRAEAASLHRKGTWRDAPPCHRSRSCGALSRLEPDEAKVSRPVLRGGGGRKTTSLPDRGGTRHQQASRRSKLRISGHPWLSSQAGHRLARAVLPPGQLIDRSGSADIPTWFA